MFTVVVTYCAPSSAQQMFIKLVNQLLWLERQKTELKST